MLRQTIASVSRRVAAAPAHEANSSICKRAFSSFSPLRPSLAARPTVFARPSALSPPSWSATPTPSAQAADGIAAAAADLVPKTSITAHPALSQIRCGPRNTMNGNSRLIQKRRHGFVSRMKTRNGRKIIKRRRESKRRIIGCAA